MLSTVVAVAVNIIINNKICHSYALIYILSYSDHSLLIIDLINHYITIYSC